MLLCLYSVLYDPKTFGTVLFKINLTLPKVINSEISEKNSCLWLLKLVSPVLICCLKPRFCVWIWFRSCSHHWPPVQMLVQLWLAVFTFQSRNIAKVFLSRRGISIWGQTSDSSYASIQIHTWIWPVLG